MSRSDEVQNLGLTATQQERRADWGHKLVPLAAATFGQAIDALWRGLRVARKGWNGKNMYLELQVPDSHSKMSLPYIYMKTAQGDLVPWLASQTDMLARDWEEYEEAALEVPLSAGGSAVHLDHVAAALQVYGIVHKFIQDHKVSCAEATVNDRVYEHAPELVEKLAEVVGYYKDPENEE